MRTTLKNRFFAETAIWYQDGQINRDQRELLLERYRAQPIGLRQITRGLAIFALLCVGLSVTALLATLAQSLFGAAVLLALLSGVSIHQGIRLCTTTPSNHRFSGSALITIGLITSYAFLFVGYLVCGGRSTEALAYTVNLYVVSILGVTLAYRSRTTSPLVFALICLFHAIGGPHTSGIDIDVLFSLQDGYSIACLAAVVVVFGIYHERVLEQSKFKRHADFGDCLVKWGLLYLNSALLFLSIDRLLHSAEWNGLINALTVVLAIEIGIGILFRDSRFIAFGTRFLQLQIFVRIVAHSSSISAVALTSLVVGLLSVGLGFYFVSLNRALIAAALPRPSSTRSLRRELSELVRLLIVSAEQASQLRNRYALTNWEFGDLAGWYIFGGAFISIVSIAVFVSQIVELTLTHAVVALALTFFALLAAANFLKSKGKPTGAALSELLAALAFVACSLALGRLLSDGSHSPTLLLFCDLGAVMAMAYHFSNYRVLYLGLALLYSFVISLSEDFAAGSSHVLGLSVPLRTLLTAAGVSYYGFIQLRAVSQPRERFSTTWIWSGVLVAELSLCLLAIGETSDFGYSDSDSSLLSLLLFNLVWAGTNVALVMYSTHFRLPMLASIGILFGIVQPYVIFFRFIAPSLGATLSFFIAGATALALVFNLEAFTAPRKQLPRDKKHS